MVTPKVSVLTPIYNTDVCHLRECIESVLNQTFSDFEFIILNDSPENKALDALVASFDDARIRYVKNDKNMGISASRNKLLGLARGEYIAIFDHDDICVTDRLAAQVEFLDSNPAVGVVSGLLEVFGINGRECILPAPENDTDIKIMTMRDCCVAHSAAMIRKSVLDENNICYEAYFSPAEDYRLWARLMAVTRFYNIQRVLVKYRNHDNRTSIVQNTRMTAAHRAIALDLRNSFPAYYREMQHSDTAGITIFRLRLFGVVPLLKIKNNRVLLFEAIPVFRIFWR